MTDTPSDRVTFDAADLTADQRDDKACVVCGADLVNASPDVPVGIVDGGQVFACASHVEPVTGTPGAYPDGESDLVREAEEFDRKLIRIVQRIERDHGPMASNTMLRVLTAVTDDPPKLTVNEAADLLRLVGRGEWESAAARERWGFSDSRARQLIGAAQTVTNVTAAGLPAPANEGQARELARVPEPVDEDERASAPCAGREFAGPFGGLANLVRPVRAGREGCTAVHSSSSVVRP